MFKKAKITVYCPHCGAEQLEPSIARSTYCRTCSEYFAIGPAVMSRPKTAPAAGSGGGNAGLPARGPRLVTPALPPTVTPPTATAVTPSTTAQPSARDPGAPPTNSPAPAPAEPTTPAPFVPSTFPRPSRPDPAASAEGGGSLRERFGSFFHAAPKSQMVRCFECNGAQEVSGTAHSTICRDCGAYVDLQDYKISGSFSRNIVTRGTVTLAKGGDLSSSKVVCSAATIHGRLRGNLLCSGKVTLRSRGRMPGTLEAGFLVIEKGSEIDFTRPVRVAGLEVFGIISGPLFECDGHVNIHRHGALRGSVRAKGFFVETNGGFEGELTIRPRQPVEHEPATAAAGAEEPHAVPGTAAGHLPMEPRHVWAQSAELIGEEPSAG